MIMLARLIRLIRDYIDNMLHAEADRPGEVETE